MRNSGYLRNYESALRLLAVRGHSVHLGFFKISEVFQETAIAELVTDIPEISYTVYPQRTGLWKWLSRYVRQLQTYLRFLDVRYKDANKLRARAASLLPPPVSWLIKVIVGNSNTRRWFFIKFLRLIEKAIPLDPFILDVFKSHHPDVFLVTPLIDLRASQLDWLKAAKALGIKSCMCVASWDNLSNKSLIQIETDIVLVWNEIQKSEAVTLHKILPPKIIVTGAQCYDRWFARRPSTSVEEFSHQVGLNPKIPYILYLCSSPFIAPNEVDFIVKWVQTLRKHKHPQTSELGVLIRPHPQNALQWEGLDFSSFENVVVYPRKGANPIDEKSVKDFFDSMYHCEAAVGINTSTMIEAGILEKPVFTILAPEFNHTQEGTLHFHYLVKGGLLYIGTSLSEHSDQLSTVLNGQTSHKEKIRTFVENFIRPHGLAKPSSPIFVEALEIFHKQNTVTLNRKTIWTYALTVLLTPLALTLYGMSWIANSLKAKNIKKS